MAELRKGASRRRTKAVGHGVPAVLKCVGILRLLDAQLTAGASLSAVSAKLTVTKSHCLSIMRTLVDLGWVRHDVQRRLYFLDTGLLRDVPNLLGQQDRSSQLHEELVRLSRRTHVPCVLTRINPDDSYIAIDKAEEGAELLASVPIGHRFPWDAPAQLRARLAFCEAGLRDVLVAKWRPTSFTRNTVATRKDLIAEIEATRRRGYSVGRGEYTLGVMSLAVPVFDRFGAMRMILQCPGLEVDLDARKAEVGTALVRAAKDIGRLL